MIEQVKRGEKERRANREKRKEQSTEQKKQTKKIKRVAGQSFQEVFIPLEKCSSCGEERFSNNFYIVPVFKGKKRERVKQYMCFFCALQVEKRNRLLEKFNKIPASTIH